MSYRSGVFTGFLICGLLLGAAIGAWFILGKPIEGSKPTPHPVQAVVAKTAKEDEFNKITITEDAEKRLDIRIGTIERKEMRRVRDYGGEVMIPVGHTILVAAPLSGTLKAPPAGVPQAGKSVKQGDLIFQLVLLLTPEFRANTMLLRDTAEANMKNADELLNAAIVTLKQAKSTLASMTGTQGAVDDAEAQVAIRRKGLETATETLNRLTGLLKQSESGITSEVLRIDCPQDGLLRNINAMQGQYVNAGAPLFEVLDLSTLWVRVPVYVGDATELDAASNAMIGNLSAKPGEHHLSAKPIAAPPSANPLGSTVDLYYELDKSATKYSPGQRVSATVPLKGDKESLTVPWSAVIHDIHGGTWVYEVVGERVYNRKRVVVRYVSGETAVLGSRHPVGTKVVTAGAAELFGTETGFSK